MRPLRRDGPRLALVLVWLGTAAASLWDGGRAGQQLLLASGVAALPALGLVWAGALWDAAIGLALALHPRKRVYALALAGMLLMTLLATALQPALWLDPLGPLLKNLAIAALLLQGLHKP
ncbi:DoxX-like family protein [Inhella proteolytica]|uniref:Epimerase n=1 Tax=Inhella proteolytica TaxID=2795029 RepID=A0A931J660_9BURK|nr:DoxX-like family protein [Inhella proteolytica]MBH9578981.1 epimerase [Inhella proteolytica]